MQDRYEYLQKNKYQLKRDPQAIVSLSGLKIIVIILYVRLAIIVAGVVRVWIAVLAVTYY